MQAWQQLLDAVGLTTTQVLAIALGLVGLLAAGRWLIGRRRRQAPGRPQPELAIDIAELGETGPSATGPALELYHMPMRLAALVISPAGRGSDPPDEDRLPAIVDQLVPGLGAVLLAHDPLVRIWPAQLSSQGFANAFFSRARLPGTDGKGTCWCTMAGRFEADGQKYQAGLVLRAAAVNNLGRVLVERDSQWLDLLRVRLKRDS